MHTACDYTDSSLRTRLYMRILSQGALSAILSATRAVLSVHEPLEYARPPVEIHLLVCTLLSQLCSAVSTTTQQRTTTATSNDNANAAADSYADGIYEVQEVELAAVRHRDFSRGLRLRRFLSQCTSHSEFGCAIGHAAWQVTQYLMVLLCSTADSHTVLTAAYKQHLPAR
jgi:hypothetical protein